MQGNFMTPSFSDSSFGTFPNEDPNVMYPRISQTLLLIFCGYVIIWYLQIGDRFPALGAIRIEFIYAATLTLLALVATPKFETKCPLVPYVVLYFLAIAIQVPASLDLNTSWQIFFDRIIKFSFMAFFIVSYVRSPKHLKFFIGAFLLACLKMGQEGLVGRLSGSLIWENQGIMRLHGSTTMYSHPNSFSGMALGTLPFAYFLWPLCNRYFKFILIIISLLSMNIIIYTGSRTGYVGLLAFVVYLFFISDNKKKFIAYFLVLAALSLPLVPSDYYDRFDSIFTRQDKEGHSTQKRIQILDDAWDIFCSYPLGIGIAAFPKVRMERFGRFQDTHNLYLEIATNLGIQGFIIVCLFIFKMLSILKIIRTNAIKQLSSISLYQYKYNNLASDLSWVVAISSATTGFLIIRLALGLFGMDLYEIYWWFALGLTISLYNISYSIENRSKKLNTLISLEQSKQVII
jgi:putative inorganic carbon (hco3(-)) transporter